MHRSLRGALVGGQQLLLTFSSTGRWRRTRRTHRGVLLSRPWQRLGLVLRVCFLWLFVLVARFLFFSCVASSYPLVAVLVCCPVMGSSENGVLRHGERRAIQGERVGTLAPELQQHFPAVSPQGQNGRVHSSLVLLVREKRFLQCGSFPFLSPDGSPPDPRIDGGQAPGVDATARRA